MPDPNLSLTAIYQAAQQPARSSRLREALRTADQQHIDRLVHRIVHHLHHPIDNWPPRRLLRCLDYIITHAPAINLGSSKLRVCVKFIFEYLLGTDTMVDTSTTTATAYSGLHLIGSLMQSSSSVNNTPLLSVIHVTSILDWLAPTWDMKLRSCAVRALTAKGQYFADDIILADGFWVLATQMGRIPIVLQQGGGDEINLCIRVSQFLENLIKHASKSKVSQVRTKLIQFIESIQFIMIINAWKTSLELQHQKLTDSLTHIVSRCMSVAPTPVADYIHTADPGRSWRNLLAQDMKAFALLVQKHEEIKSIQATRITRLCKIALNIALSGKEDEARAGDIARDIVNFFLVIIPRPVKPEDIDSIGTVALATREMWHGEVDDHVGYIISQHELMCVTLLECFMQHVQVASQQLVQSIAARAAFCIIAILTALNDSNKLDEEQGLRSRLEKLVMFFLHYHEAIDMFSTAPTCLNNVIWLPTIEHAKLGLSDIQHQDITLSRAKRAFTALRMATHHVKACEKLDKAGVLQLLVDMDYTRQLDDAPSNMLLVYASFMHFIAALAAKMAYIRAKLRAEFPIGPLVMKLLCRGVYYTTRYQNMDGLYEGWNHIIRGSLLVVNAFGYDPISLQQWLAWPASLSDNMDENDTSWYNTVHINDGRLSIIPAILLVLLPCRDNDDISDTQVITHFKHQDESVIRTACISLSLLSPMVECGSQLIKNIRAFGQLSTLVVFLSDDNTDIPSSSSLETPMQVDQEYSFDKLNEDEIQSPVNNNTTTDATDTLCFNNLYRALIRVLTCQENLRAVISSDVLTSVFRPLLYERPLVDKHKAKLRHMISDSLHRERLDDLSKLFRFTMGDQNATQFHEMCAVALGYACPYIPLCHTILGISTADGESILESNSAFGVLCRMLVYELVEEEESVVDAPYRRQAAAQVIEVLAQNLFETWSSELNQTRNELKETLASRPRCFNNGTTLADIDDQVIFVTKGSSQQQLYANRQVLVRQSPYFAALFSGQYAESAQHPIPLPDVSYEAFAVYLNAAEYTMISNDVDKVMSACHGWKDVVELLMMADRFSNDDLRLFCEAWIVNELMNAPSSMDTLNGALLLYRRCRDTEGGIFLADIWPFSHILREALKSVVSRLSLAIATNVFQDMIQDAHPEELGAFCHGISILFANSVQ
ncbi:hypothetical protein K492DRAFT_239973 [Lichtheimia hyalospora FSU 10163]|nr:hypothetical protein K492DRAFT_239973 [Lichtheimia hyalospora FSU 10163]